MEQRTLGRTDLKVSPLGLGCAALGSRTGRREAEAAVRAAMDQGVRFFDTAPFYGQGQSEEVLGRVVGSDPSAVIATKVGLLPSKSLQLLSKVKPLVRSVLTKLPGPHQRLVQKSVQGMLRSSGTVSFDADTIRQSVEGSLKRLRREQLDLLLLHVSPPEEEIDETLGVLRALQESGKVRYIGASAAGGKDVTAWSERQVDALQVRLNLYEQDVIETLPRAVEQGVGIIAREPFALGRLLPDAPAAGGNQLAYLGEPFDDRFAFLGDGQTSVPQAALRYLLMQPGVDTVLAGMSSAKHIAHNVDAVNLPELSADMVARVSQIARETA